MWKAITRVLFWRYERGSLPYDIMCGFILAFIFLTPPAVFDGSLFSDNPNAEAPRAEPDSNNRSHTPAIPDPEEHVEGESGDGKAQPKSTE